MKCAQINVYSRLTVLRTRNDPTAFIWGKPTHVPGADALGVALFDDLIKHGVSPSAVIHAFGPSMELLHPAKKLKSRLGPSDGHAGFW